MCRQYEIEVTSRGLVAKATDWEMDCDIGYLVFEFTLMSFGL